MAFFNIKRKEEELTPEQISEQIKTIKEQIKACKSDISQLKIKRANAVKDINEKISAENVSYEKEIKKLTLEKEGIIRKAKNAEKKKTAKLKVAQAEHKKSSSKLNDVKKIASDKVAKKLRENKRELQIKLAQVESDFASNKEAIDIEHNKAVENYKTLIDFEENATKEAREEKERIIEQYEIKLADLQGKQVKLNEAFDIEVDEINKKHDEEINKVVETLSKERSDLKQLYIDLDAISEKRNKALADYNAEKAELEKELETLKTNNETDIKNAMKLNESLQIEAKETQDQLDALIDKYNTEYSDLKYFLGTLVEQISVDTKVINEKNKAQESELEKEFAQRLVALRKQFDEDVRESNSELENEVNNIKLNIEKNKQTYSQILKDSTVRNDSLLKDYVHSLESVTNEKDNLINEIRSLETNYKEQIKNYNAQINETKANNKQYIDQLKAKCANEIQDLINSYENKKLSKIEELKNDLREAKETIRSTNSELKQYLADYENRKSTLITQYEKEISALKSKHDSLNSSIRLLNEELETKREAFAKDFDDIRAKIESQKNSKTIKMKDLEAEHNNKIAEIQQRYDNDYADLVKTNEINIKKINEEADARKKELEIKSRVYQEEFEGKKQKIEEKAESIKAKYESQINKVMDQQNDLSNQIITLKDNLVNSEELFKQELALLSHNFEENKAKIEEDYNNKLNDIIKQYEVTPTLEIETLKAQLEDAKANYANLNVELLEKKNQMQYDYNAKKSELQARQDEIAKEIEKKNELIKELTDEKEDEYQSQIYRLNEKKNELEALKDEIKNENDRIMSIHNANLAKLTETYNTKYNETVSKFNEEEMILRDRLEGELQYVTRDFDRKKADFDVRLNEVTIKKDQIESDLKARYNAELEKSKTIENEVKSLQEDLNFKKVSYETQIENKKKQFEEETNKFKAKQNEELLVQKAHYADIIAELQIKKEQLSKEIDLLAYEYNDKARAVEEIRQTQNKDLSLLRIQLTQLIEQFNKNDVFGEKQAKIELMYDRRIAEIKKDFASIVAEFDNLQETREGVGEITKSNELEITRKTEEFKRVLESLDDKHNQTMNELKSQYDITLKQIADDFKLYVQGNKDSINDCENEIISLQTTYDDLIKEEEARIVKLEAERTLHNRQIEMMQKQFDAKIKQIDDNYSELSDDDRIKAQYAFESERRSYENQIEELKDEIKNLDQPKPALNLKLRDLAKQKTDLESDMFEKKQKLIELLDEAFSKVANSYKDRVELKKAQLKEFDIYSNNKLNIFK